MATANNPTLGSIPIRRGFWDADWPTGDIGWGMDKAWNKHNIWSVEAMRRVMLSTNITVQGTQRLLKAYAGRYTCTGIACALREQMEIYAVYNPNSYSNYYDWPVGGKLGMQTMYCNQGGAWACPNWVTFAIVNPGANNPYGRGRTPDSAVSDDQLRQQQEGLTSREVVELREAIDSGDAQVRFAFEPLPETVSVG